MIETRKDQLAKMRFTIRPIDPKQKVDARCAEVESFMRLPDGENTWDTWLRMLLEDMFVLDAATVYPWLRNNGKPYRFEIIDGSTVKRVLDDHGRTPVAPQPAYQQVFKGVVATQYTIDELIYAPRNRRSHKVYGYSPVEQVLLTVNIAIRRALFQLQYYTEGSTPDLLFQCPPNWNMAQIKDLNSWWQSTLAGNTAQRRKAQFVPNGVTPINTKEGVLTDKYDEWLARVICYAFSVSHQAFVAQMNRATSESAQQQALEEGLYPIMQWVKGIVDRLIWKYFQYDDLHFVWQDQDVVAPDIQSQIDDRNVRNGSITINEVRAKRGDEPITGGDDPMVLTQSGYVPITAYKDQKVVQSSQPTMEKIAKQQIKPIDRNSASAQLETKVLATALAKTFKGMLASVVKQFDAMSKIGKSDKADDIDFDEWVERLEGSLEQHLIWAAKFGAKEAYQQLAIDAPDSFALANDKAVEWAKDRAASLVGMAYVDGELVPNPKSEFSILDSTREMIREQVSGAVDEGWTAAELADKLQDGYAFGDARAEMIARTEMASAQVQGSLEGYRESGVVESKEWLTADGCCDDCQDLNGVVVSLDEEFPNDGGDGPPLHPQCKCAIIPVVFQDENN